MIEKLQDTPKFEIPPQQERPSRVVKRAMIAGTALLPALVVFYFLGVFGGHGDTHLNASHKVSTGSVQRTLPTFGQLVPEQSAIVSAQSPGLVAEVFVDSGSSVMDSTPILRLENDSLSRQIEEARTDLLEAQANEQATLARVSRELAGGRNEVADAESELALQTSKVEMMSRLAASGNVSQLQFLEAQQAKERAELRLSTANAYLAAIEQAITAERRSSELQVRSIEQRIANLATDIDRLTVRASRAGLIELDDEVLELGRYVETNQVVGSISEPSKLHAELFVSEARADEVEVGQSVELRSSDSTFEGEVRRVATTASEGQVEVEAVLLSDVGSLRINASVSGRIFSRALANTKRIPIGVLRTQAGLSEIPATVTFPDGERRDLNINIGVIGDEYIQVLDDIPDDSSVVFHQSDQ